MRISDLSIREYHKGIDLYLKIIYDIMPSEEQNGKNKKNVVVVDIDNDTSCVPSALLELTDDDVNSFKFKDRIRVVNCYAKKMNNKQMQYRIFKGGFGKYERC